MHVILSQEQLLTSLCNVSIKVSKSSFFFFKANNFFLHLYTLYAFCILLAIVSCSVHTFLAAIGLLVAGTLPFDAGAAFFPTPAAGCLTPAPLPLAAVVPPLVAALLLPAAVTLEEGGFVAAGFVGVVLLGAGLVGVVLFGGILRIETNRAFTL